MIRGYNPKKFWNDRIDGRSILPGKWICELENVLFKEKHANLLEVGCGFGVNTRYIQARFPKLKVTGIDFAEHCIAKADKYRGDEEYYLHDANGGLPLENNSVDIILCAAVLMHVKPEKIGHLVSEIKRTAKKTVFLFEQRGEQERHSNGFVFYHNYDSLFDLPKKHEAEWERNYWTTVFKLEGKE